MKKFLILISPLCVILFILMWIFCGLEVIFAFFGTVLFSVIVAILFSKWMVFVDKHIKD